MRKQSFPSSKYLYLNYNEIWTYFAYTAYTEKWTHKKQSTNSCSKDIVLWPCVESFIISPKVFLLWNESGTLVQVPWYCCWSRVRMIWTQRRSLAFIRWLKNWLLFLENVFIPSSYRACKNSFPPLPSRWF